MENSIVLDLVKTFSIAILTLLFLSAVIYLFAQYRYFSKKYLKLSKSNVFLFVTAHPDDEWNYEGKGLLRQQELYESCALTGIPPSNVTILDSSLFVDGPANWNLQAVIPEVYKVVKKVKPDCVFIFDGYGVSGHCNHIDTAKAVRHVFSTSQADKEKLPILYELESVPVYRKYLGLLDVPLSLTSESLYVLSSVANVIRAQRAMLAHKSQLVWFRWLYIAFSRYMIINTLRRVKAQAIR